MKNRLGFTLIEVLVSVAIIGILTALLLPALQAARVYSRRLACCSNLKQIGISVDQYHGVYGSYPSGRSQSYDPRYAGLNPPCTSNIVDKSMLVRILPYVEQATIYNAINQSLSIFAQENRTVHTVTISAFSCPADITAGMVRSVPLDSLKRYGYEDDPTKPFGMAFSSYVGSVGSLAVTAFPQPGNHCATAAECVQQNNGVFNDLQGLTVSSVTDGLSNTIFASERTGNFLQGIIYNGSSLFSQRGWFVSGNWGDTLFSAQYPINAFKNKSKGAGYALTDSASSLHPGGVNVLFGDGSVRFVTESIQSWNRSQLIGYPATMTLEPQGYWSGAPAPGIWQALSTRSSSELINSGGY